jgi:hypothetical protein
MDADVRTETSAEALQALERATASPPKVLDPAVAEQQRAAIRVVEALLREHTWLAEVEAWIATRPLQRLTEALGMVMGEPNTESNRPVRLLSRVIDATQALLRAPRRDRLQRIATQLAAADDPEVIETLVAQVTKVAVELRQARSAFGPWRDNVNIVEDEARQTIAALQAWLADCAHAREGSA